MSESDIHSYISVTDAPHNIESLRVSGEETLLFLKIGGQSGVEHTFHSQKQLYDWLKKTKYKNDYSIVQSQKAVYAHFTSKQMPPFAFVHQYCRA